MGDKFLFAQCLMTPSDTYFRYDLHSGVQDTIGNHDDLAICVEFCEETCKLLMLPCFKFNWCLTCILNATLYLCSGYFNIWGT